ncbi:MAG: hypothetical protein PUE42_07680, partial [Subdoligranulum sp.]|nr:hypothetical protein [Subdoligranulum sp.]
MRIPSGYLKVIFPGWKSASSSVCVNKSSLWSDPACLRAIPHNSKCRYGERGAADAKPKAQIILDVLSSILATQMPCRSCRSGA